MNDQDIHYVSEAIKEDYRINGYGCPMCSIYGSGSGQGYVNQKPGDFTIGEGYGAGYGFNGEGGSLELEA